jgi:hypothetical protein
MTKIIHDTDYSGAGIYALFNVIENKVYIGRSKNIKQRFASHRSLFANCSKVSPMYSRPISDFVFMVLYEMNDDDYKKIGHIIEVLYIFEIGCNHKLYNESPKNKVNLIRAYLAEIFDPAYHFNHQFFKLSHQMPYTLDRASTRRRKEILDTCTKEEQA